MSEYKPIPLPDRISITDDDMRVRSEDHLTMMQKRHTVRHYSDRQVASEIIENCIAVATSAPSGANQQPWHFVAISDPSLKTRIRHAAEEEEKAFYSGGGGDEWIRALEPIGTGPNKPHLEVAPWLIVVFAQRYGEYEDGTRYKHYYVNESVGIATGFLLTALHNVGLSTLTHTPNPMKFLNEILKRPENEKPVMIIATGHAATEATVPAAAKNKKAAEKVRSFF